MRTAAWLALPLGLMLAAGCLGGRGSDEDAEPATPTPGPPADPGAARQMREVAGGLSEPLWAMAHPLQPGLLLVAQRGGSIVAHELASGNRTPWLDLTDRVGSAAPEQGLLGFAFHPQAAENGVLVVSYTDRAGDSVLSRFVLDAPTAAPEPAGEEVLLQVDQPFDNHNGGHVLWGPDGHLYYGLGDGGLAGDPNLNGQNRATLLGSILRIDVGPSGPYTVPDGNPFVDDPQARPEIWAYGLRNPWRFHFDDATGDLWIGDVGQNVYEEVDRQPGDSAGGENYGWNLFEGNHQCPSGVQVPADVPSLTVPVHEYRHEGGHCSVTMGPVYRGAALPALAGRPLLADFCSGVVWALREEGDAWAADVVLETGFLVSSFGEDAQGEVLVMDYAGGRVLRLSP